MTRFTTRVELHDARSHHYDILHEEMALQGFARTIRSDNGGVYLMPQAEYNFEGALARDQVLEKAKAAAARTGLQFSILVTESAGRTWHNLEDVKKTSSALR